MRKQTARALACYWLVWCVSGVCRSVCLLLVTNKHSRGKDGRHMQRIKTSQPAVKLQTTPSAAAAQTMQRHQLTHVTQTLWCILGERLSCRKQSNMLQIRPIPPPNPVASQACFEHCLYFSCLHCSRQPLHSGWLSAATAVKAGSSRFLGPCSSPSPLPLSSMATREAVEAVVVVISLGIFIAYVLPQPAATPRTAPP